MRRWGLTPGPGLPLGLSAASIGIVAALTGCSGSSPGDTGATLPPAATSSTPDSPTPPDSSAPAAGERAASAAVVRHYYSLLNGATSLSNAHQIASLMTAGCKCRVVATSTIERVRKHEHFFGRNNVDVLRAVPEGSNAAVVLVTYHYTRSGTATRNGRVIAEEPARKDVREEFHLSQIQGRWLIAGITSLDPGVQS